MGFNPEDENSNLNDSDLDIALDDQATIDLSSVPDTTEPVEKLDEITLPNGALDVDQFMSDESPAQTADDLLNSLEKENETEVDETLMDLEQYRKHYRNNSAQTSRANASPAAPDQPRRKKKSLAVPIIIFLILVGVGGGLVFFAKNLKDKIAESNPTPAAQSSTVQSSDSEKEAEKDDIETDTFYVTGARKNGVEKIYEKATKESPVVGEAKNGDEIKVIKDAAEKGYSKVQLKEDGKTGYIRTSRLVSNPAFVADYSTYYVNVEKNNKVALLKTTSPGSDKIGSLTTNQKVHLVAKASVKYWYVYSSDLKKYGYIDKDLIETAKYKTAAEKKAEKEKKEAEKKQKAEEEARKKAEKEQAKQNQQNQNQQQNQQQQNQQQTPTYPTYYVSGTTNYLALRNAQSFDASNEIGQIYNGQEVQVISSGGAYWYVYVPALGMEGYVNGDYLTSDPNNVIMGPANTNSYYVTGTTYYLALRNAQSYDERNEIGKIYNGQEVQVISSGGTYWYVYVPALGMKGYVNSGYLTK